MDGDYSSGKLSKTCGDAVHNWNKKKKLRLDSMEVLFLRLSIKTAPGHPEETVPVFSFMMLSMTSLDFCTFFSAVEVS